MRRGSPFVRTRRAAQARLGGCAITASLTSSQRRRATLVGVMACIQSTLGVQADSAAALAILSCGDLAKAAAMFAWTQASGEHIMGGASGAAKGEWMAACAHWGFYPSEVAGAEDLILAQAGRSGPKMQPRSWSSGAIYQWSAHPWLGCAAYWRRTPVSHPSAGVAADPRDQEFLQAV